MRTRKLLDNVKQIIRQRRRGRMLDSPFRAPDIIKHGDAPHAQDGLASSPTIDATLGNPRSTSAPDPDAPATSLAQDTSEIDDERQAKRARQESSKAPTFSESKERNFPFPNR